MGSDVAPLSPLGVLSEKSPRFLRPSTEGGRFGGGVGFVSSA